MNRHPLIQKVESQYLKKEIPSFHVGDIVKVSQKVTEGGKTRTQAFEGTVIAKRGSGLQASFTVRRISFGEGVEKTYPIHSSTVQGVTVVRSGKVRRAKLYYLRQKSAREGRIESAAGSEESTAAAGGV